MNKWIGIGRLTQDPDIKHVESNGEQLTIATYTLAVNRKGKKDETDYIRCKAFGKTAEFVEQYLSKGLKMMVCGRIQTGSYENKEGQKVYTTDVVASRVEFLSTGNQSSGGGSFGGGQQSFNDTSAPANSGASDVPPGFNDLQDDDIPF